MLSNAIIKLGYSHLTLAALRCLQSPSASREIQWISTISTICNFYFTFVPSFLHSFIYCSILKFDFAIRGSLFSYSSSVPKHGVLSLMSVLLCVCRRSDAFKVTGMASCRQPEELEKCGGWGNTRISRTRLISLLWKKFY